MCMWAMKFRPVAGCRYPLCAELTGCPWRLCRLHPWRYSKYIWTMLWETWPDLGTDPAVWGKLDQKPSEVPSSPNCAMLLFSDQQLIAAQLSWGRSTISSLRAGPCVPTVWGVLQRYPGTQLQPWDHWECGAHQQSNGSFNLNTASSLY